MKKTLLVIAALFTTACNSDVNCMNNIFESDQTSENNIQKETLSEVVGSDTKFVVVNKNVQQETALSKVMEKIIVSILSNPQPTSNSSNSAKLPLWQKIFGCCIDFSKNVLEDTLSQDLSSGNIIKSLQTNLLDTIRDSQSSVLGSDSLEPANYKLLLSYFLREPFEKQVAWFLKQSFLDAEQLSTQMTPELLEYKEKYEWDWLTTPPLNYSNGNLLLLINTALFRKELTNICAASLL